VRGHDADGERELVQDTFAKAFAAAARQAYDGVSPYRPYLLRITKNLMIDRYRAAQRTPVELDETGVGDIDQLLAANAELAAGERRDLVDVAVVDRRQRLALSSPKPVEELAVIREDGHERRNL
jgi:DNA-directed RNA polymerase specialized sigma24 family protein